MVHTGREVVTHSGQTTGRNQHNAVEVEPVNALHCWDHTVHPRERLLICAGRPLLCNYHNTFVSQYSDGEHRNSEMWSEEETLTLAYFHTVVPQSIEEGKAVS